MSSCDGSKIQTRFFFGAPFVILIAWVGTGIEHDDRLFRPVDQRKEDRQSLARVQVFSVSLDGSAPAKAWPRRAVRPAGESTARWMFVTRWWHKVVGEPGGSGDDAVLRLHDPGIGAEIMGAGKFGYPGWHEDSAWKGWWGDEPPFHTPVLSSPSTHARRSR